MRCDQHASLLHDTSAPGTNFSTYCSPRHRGRRTIALRPVRAHLCQRSHFRHAAGVRTCALLDTRSSKNTRVQKPRCSNWLLTVDMSTGAGTNDWRMCSPRLLRTLTTCKNLPERCAAASCSHGGGGARSRAASAVVGATPAALTRSRKHAGRRVPQLQCPTSGRCLCRGRDRRSCDRCSHAYATPRVEGTPPAQPPRWAGSPRRRALTSPAWPSGSGSRP